MFLIDPPSRPPTIVYGTRPPELRLRAAKDTQTYFCLNNRNLHLADDDFHQGTYEAGRLLWSLHRELCEPHLQKAQPCPAFVKSWKVGTENKGLATVELNPVPRWETCGGVKELLAIAQTEEERAFLIAYLENKWTDESEWRDELVAAWNEGWPRVKDGWAGSSRRGKFEWLLFATLRFPALIPQVWLNWLHAAPERLLKTLERNPSRVDFVAFWQGGRYVVEIDGPSHYADWNGSAYRIDEKAYARNLRIERSLRAQKWPVTRIGRYEVEEAMSTEDDDGFVSFLRWSELLEALPFYKNEGYPETWGIGALHPELVPVGAAAADDDIPF